jgi:hypothetical protein
MKRKKWATSFIIVVVFVLAGPSSVVNAQTDCGDLIAQDNSSQAIDTNPGVFVLVKTLPFHLDSVSNIVVDFDLGHSHGCCHHDALEFRLHLDGVEIFSASFPFVNGNPSGCANTTFDTAVLGDVAAGGHLLEVFLGDEGQNCFLEVFACPPSVCELGTVCDEHICKTVTYRTADGDCLVEAGEKVDFQTTIEVVNSTDVSWDKVVIGDCFFSDIVVTNVHTQQGSTQQFQAGNHKTCIRWKPGDLDPGDSATLVIDAETGVDRRGRQEYVRCSNHPFNNGALLRFVDPHNQSFRTGPIVVSVLTPDAEGDCDGDGFSDQEELDAGSDPHDPDDQPDNMVCCDMGPVYDTGCCTRARLCLPANTLGLCAAGSSEGDECDYN